MQSSLINPYLTASRQQKIGSDTSAWNREIRSDLSLSKLICTQDLQVIHANYRSRSQMGNLCDRPLSEVLQRKNAFCAGQGIEFSFKVFKQQASLIVKIG